MKEDWNEIAINLKCNLNEIQTKLKYIWNKIKQTEERWDEQKWNETK